MERFNPNIKDGLSTKQVENRINEGLVNYDDQPKTKTIKQIIKDNFFTYFNFLNIALGASVFLAGLLNGEFFQGLKNCLFMGVIICFIAATGRLGTGGYTPAYAPENSAAGGVFTIFALTPWAFVGFESISHSAAEVRFSLKKSFSLLAVGVITAAITYVLLTLLAVKALPDGFSSWTEYIEKLDSFSGVASQPTFHSAYAALGEMGSLILGVAALGAIFTGLIGNYIALSRLLVSLSADALHRSFRFWVVQRSAGSWTLQL